ncbi:MAG: glycoside hydrolase family 2 protein [Terriglobia bacterium]|nr:glycoside hydrolase family 2 protein [Terriglobia bacterium]
MESTSIVIDKGWRFRAINDKGHPEVEQWHQAEVPGVVQTDLLHNKLIPDPFYGDNEPTLQWIGLTDWEYETEFEVTPAMLQRGHLELLFAGLDTYADVFLNDVPILSADNMFRHWRVPVKDKLHAGSNTLRIVFHSPVMYMLPKVKALPYRLPTVSQVLTVTEEGIATDPYTRKAPYNYGWDWGPRYVTEGIWQPVELYAWDDVRIDNFHIHQAKVTEAKAKLSAELDILAEAPVDVDVSIGYAEENNPTLSPKADDKGGAQQKVHLDAGMNHVAIPFEIAKPDRWYPNGYGAQALYKFTATVRRGKTSADHAQVRTGLRSLELRRQVDQWGKSFEFVVNGIPIFAKGANVIPFDSFAPSVTPEVHRRILQAAKDAHMNMVRAWGGGYYETDDFYDICDELGIMVWQDFIFGGAMVPGDLPYQKNVREETIEQVKRLRDHPSLALWNGNNEVETGWKYWGDRQAFKESISPTERERVWQDYLIMFHDIIKSVVTEYGDGTPYWPSSPSSNFEPNPDGQSNGDMHYWAVWHALAPIDDYTKQFPRFMSEYGFQSFPEMRTIRQFAGPKDLDLLSAVMQEHQKNVGGNERIRTYMLREYHEPKDFESFIYVSQVLQAEAIKVGAEHLRRQMPRVMGSLYWQLNDCWPVASWSSIDYYGRWKALQYYARRFYNDLLVSPFEVDGIVSTFVVSDKLQATPAELRIRVMDFSGKQLFENKQTITVPDLSSKIYATFKREDLLKGTDAQHAFAAFDLSVGGKVVSRNLMMFDITRNLALPVPKIQSEIAGGNGEYSLKLQSAVLARHVYLSFGDADVTLSDNYFDLLPSEPVTITLKSKMGLDEIKRAMRIRNITDAFPPGESPKGE